MSPEVTAPLLQTVNQGIRLAYAYFCQHTLFFEPQNYKFGYQMLAKDADAFLLDVSIELNTVTIEDIYEFENLWKRHYIASAKE
ncbi:MAG TPA: hypothetical protein DEG93_08825 [Gammaproteobacteria bacterium]|nr:hypothetical protein [Gammaproteobacteria bacterium]|tara:strand:+ start:1340 stop:1591 length:252 start_codon:yes stop_codon:yes gene_type:complete